MANEENLIPNSERSPNEVRENGRKGGVNSGVARRRKRSLKESADLFLSLSVSDKKEWNKISIKGVDPEDIDNQMAIIVGLSLKAAKGDSKAAKVLFDLLGEDAGAPPTSTREEDPLTKALREEAEALNNADK